MARDNDPGAEVNAWINVVRRARLGETVKLVALMVASYANHDGTSIFPGIARLAVQCEIGHSTARRALAKLRSAGLIELVKRGARKRGQADQYRLIIAADLLERIEVPTPDDEKASIELIAKAIRQSAYTARQRAVESGSTARCDPFLPLASEPPPSIQEHPPVFDPPSDAAALRTDVAVGGPNPPGKEEISSDGEDHESLPVLRTGRLPPAVAEAMARRAAARERHRLETDHAPEIRVHMIEPTQGDGQP